MKKKNIRRLECVEGKGEPRTRENAMGNETCHVLQFSYACPTSFFVSSILAFVEIISVHVLFPSSEMS